MGNQSIVEYQMPAMPAHIANFFEQNEGNIIDRTSVPSLGYEGKVWTIAVNGEKTKVMKDDGEGNEVPRAVMSVVVLGFNADRGRAYYEGTYDPTKVSAPVCWSDDGKVPAAQVAEPKASKCDGCPLAAKGSKVDDNGKSRVACSQHRMVAVVPANDLSFTPLRMKLAITSLWDDPKKDGAAMAAKGWFGFDNFTSMLRTRGVKHTAAIITKMSFDPNVAYPKVLFRVGEFLDAERIQQVGPIANSDIVKELLAGTRTPEPAKAAKEMPADDDTPPVTAPVAAAPAPAPKPAPVAAAAPAVVVPDDDSEEGEATAAPTAAELAVQKAQAKKDQAAAKAKKAAETAKAAARAPIADDDEGPAAAPQPVAAPVKAAAAADEAPPAKKTTTAAPTPTTVASVPASVGSLMDEWDD